jgi:glycosyltransferase involved in cell wall biosynthesis
VIRSLSVLLPVRNAQSSLSASVHEILDVVAELTGRFELVIIDEGSTDGTWDVARELAQLYPQIRLRQDARSERRVQMGAAHGDVVIAHNGTSPVDAQEIVRLWRSLAPAAPAPKFLGTPGAANARRTTSCSEARTQGFRVMRGAAEPRRTAATSGV